MTNPDKRRWLEILAVFITGALKYILMDWLDLRIFYISSACLFWIIYIYVRFRQDHEVMKRWGFRKKNFKAAFLFLLPFSVLAIAGIIWYGIVHNAKFLNWHVIPVLILYPFWGLIQQFLMTALIAGNLNEMTTLNLKKYEVILLTSFFFALVHYPYLPLMLYAFLMEILFTITYFRWKNLWPLGIYHGWVSSLLLFFVMGRDLWSELWRIF